MAHRGAAFKPPNASLGLALGSLYNRSMFALVDAGSLARLHICNPLGCGRVGNTKQLVHAFERQTFRLGDDEVDKRSHDDTERSKHEEHTLWCGVSFDRTFEAGSV